MHSARENIEAFQIDHLIILRYNTLSTFSNGLHGKSWGSSFENKTSRHCIGSFKATLAFAFRKIDADLKSECQFDFNQDGVAFKQLMLKSVRISEKSPACPF